MKKYGVFEDNQKDAKTAQDEKVCPRCQAVLKKHGDVLLCPRCGSEPFEEKHD